jgi:hypothetical protein
LFIFQNFCVKIFLLVRFSEHQNIVSIQGVIPDQMCIIMEVAESSLAEVYDHTLFWKYVCAYCVASKWNNFFQIFPNKRFFLKHLLILFWLATNIIFVGKVTKQTSKSYPNLAFNNNAHFCFFMPRSYKLFRKILWNYVFLWLPQVLINSEVTPMFNHGHVINWLLQVAR